MLLSNSLNTLHLIYDPLRRHIGVQLTKFWDRATVSHFLVYYRVLHIMLHTVKFFERRFQSLIANNFFYRDSSPKIKILSSFTL